MARLAAARHELEYGVWLRFSDELQGILDLAEELHGEVFEPLRDVRFLGRLRLDPDSHTIAWPNGRRLDIVAGGDACSLGGILISGKGSTWSSRW